MTDNAQLLHSRYRAAREVIVGATSVPADVVLTVFVGLYNAEPYFDDLVAQIEAQHAKNVQWLFVDNASSDETWNRLRTWARSSQCDVTLVRNFFNLGATGSIFVNLDLVRTEWVTFIHQDDIYLSDHVQSLEQASRAAQSGTVGVFSDMARADESGRPIGAYPPPIWLVPDFDPPTLFLALLRNHCIPWASMSVRTDAFRRVEAPWHSTAFPDTEITMRLVARGAFTHLDRETMRYRDNLASESRSIDNRERKFGATVSLFRVFNSEEFGDLAMELPVKDRGSFVVGLVNSIHVRLGETDRAALAVAGALERLDQIWDNSEPNVLSEIAKIYGALGANATTALLDRMSVAAGGEERATPVATPELEESQSIERSTRMAGAVMSRGYERFGQLIPYRLRRFAARRIIAFVTRHDSRSPWRFSWR